MANCPVRESIREIDQNSWLIGGKILLSRASLSDCDWQDGNGAGFKISDAPSPLPESRPLSPTSEIKLVYDAGDVSAVFSVGDVFCKARILDIPDVTREHVTLAWMHERRREQDWSFSIPNVIHHAEYDGRYYIFLGRVRGQTIDSIWETLDESKRQQYAERIGDACVEMAKYTGNGMMSGVDGNALAELYLRKKASDCSPQNLQESCDDLKMDCSTLVFNHCDLGPTNVLVDLDTGRISIIDWEIAGFVPVEWIRTKFRVSSGMNLSSGDEVDWRRRVQDDLGKKGYTDVADGFMAWLRSGKGK
ncbi:hypothetical protein J3459_017812 [Metarhizium acridum]|nr:hypothetical protein J3459_017812 [Metarhizium acridum]